jgi:lipopolysaccharide export system protein LptA
MRLRRFFLSVPAWAALALFALSLRPLAASAAPADTSQTRTVNILFARHFLGAETDSGAIQKLIDSVVLQQGTTVMRCDSAYLSLRSNNLEAFGNVYITQPGGTEVRSDYLRYTGNARLAFLKGNVSLTDGKSNLWSEELSYNVGTRTGVYTNGGTLQSDTTTVSSNEGSYNLNTHDARFRGEVFISDPSYNVTSEDLGYNTETKLVRFFGPSIVTNYKSELRTSSGSYDSKRQVAHFTARSSIRNGAQFIEADTLDYDKPTGWGIARGCVVAIDTQNHSTLWSGFASYNEISKRLFARLHPVLRNAREHDTLYIAADTFFSAPQAPPKADTASRDSAKRAVPPRQSRAEKGSRRSASSSALSAPEPPADTTAPRFFIGFHHVRIWSDSLQGVCDSIAYLPRDSVMKMMGSPVAWSRESQITGDTLLLYMDSSRVRRLYVPANALVVSRSGPPKAQLYDQVQGKTLTAFFRNNKVDHMVVFPAAESIYFPTDEHGAYLGVNQAESERMKVFFKEDKISRIIFEQEVKQKMSPLNKVSLPAMRLSRFQWLDERRPKSKEELFQQ